MRIFLRAAAACLVLAGQPGPPRQDTLEIGDNALVQHTRVAADRTVKLGYAPVGRPVRCTPLGSP